MKLKAYNKLRIKDIYSRGDSVTRPKPDYIIMGLGDGAENSHYGVRVRAKMNTPTAVLRRI